MKLFKHKAEWEHIEYVKDAGVYSKVDVDKDGNVVDGLDTKSIIIGKKNVLVIPTEKLRCKVCGKEIIFTHSYFPRPNDNPEEYH